MALSVFPNEKELEALVVYDEIGEILGRYNLFSLEDWENAELDNKAIYDMFRDIVYAYLLEKDKDGNTN